MFDVLGQFLRNPNRSILDDRVKRIANLAAQYEGCEAKELVGLVDDELRAGSGRRNGEIARIVAERHHAMREAA